MGIHSFPKEEKLCSLKAIEALFANGKGTVAYPLRVVACEVAPSEGQCAAQVLISVPKRRVRSSPGRNRVKRLVREAWRLRKHGLLQAWAGQGRAFHIAFVLVGDAVPDLREVGRAMDKAVGWLGRM